MRSKTGIFIFLLCSGTLLSQDIKNANYLDLTVSKTGKAADGSELNYYNIEGTNQRALQGKEFIFYKTVIEAAVGSVDAAWVNNPNWKRRDNWNYGPEITAGLYRTEKSDELAIPSKFNIKNIILPGEKNPLYKYYHNQLDSLFNPKVHITKPREYTYKLQDFENNSPRIEVNIRINDNLNETSISKYTEVKWTLPIKMGYKIVQKNDSIWYFKENKNDQNSDDLRFQKNTIYIVLGNVKDIAFSEDFVPDIEADLYKVTVPYTKATSTARLDNITIEVSGNNQTIKSFIDKIDWKKLEKQFKLK